MYMYIYECVCMCVSHGRYGASNTYQLGFQFSSLFRLTTQKTLYTSLPICEENYSGDRWCSKSFHGIMVAM